MPTRPPLPKRRAGRGRRTCRAPRPGGTIIAIAVIVALLVGALAGLAGGYAGARLASGSGFDIGTMGRQTTSVVPTTTADEPVIAAAAAAVPSVVNIDVTESAVKTRLLQARCPATTPTCP